jgi:hypothetical protein
LLHKNNQLEQQHSQQTLKSTIIKIHVGGNRGITSAALFPFKMSVVRQYLGKFNGRFIYSFFPKHASTTRQANKNPSQIKTSQ